MLNFLRMLGLAGAICLVFQGVALAHDHRHEVSVEGTYVTRPSLLQYGWNGLSIGLGVGLASGYLATGSEFESGEWRTILYGAGIGALSGIGAGLLVGLADVGAAPDIPGAIILRDIGYGSSLGTVGGLIVGGLVALDSGELRDLVVGGAVGTLVGAGSGLIFGIVEAAVVSGDNEHASAAGQRRAQSRPGVHFAVNTQPDIAGKWVLMPTAYGRF